MDKQDEQDSLHSNFGATGWFRTYLLTYVHHEFFFKQRNVDKELSKKELLDILVAMESELQARELAFAALKVGCSKQIF